MHEMFLKGYIKTGEGDCFTKVPGEEGDWT
jgi:hypothetical protein